MPLPTPEAHGLTLEAIAALSRSAPNVRAVIVGRAAVPKVGEEVALDWLRQCQEAGFDIGLPKDTKSLRSTHARRDADSSA